MTAPFPHRFAVAAALLVAQVAQAQAQDCREQASVGTRPGEVGRVIECREPLARSPVVLGLVGRIGNVEGLAQETAAAVRRLERSAGQAAQGLSPQQQQALVDNVVRRLQFDREQSEARLQRALERLDRAFEDWADRVSPMLADGTRRPVVVAALGGAAGDALSRLDFGTADQLLDEVAALKADMRELGRQQERVLAQERLRSAREQFDRAVAARPYDDTAHLPAMELLNAEGRSFAGENLGGLSLQGASLPGWRAEDVQLTAARLGSLKAPRAQLSRSRLVLAEAGDADLSEALLARSVATYAVMPRVRLRKAVLTRVSWSYADLRDADLSGADLRGANLSAADLRGANLSGADLTGAYLIGADLRGVRLEGATLRDVDLAAALIDDAVVPRLREVACATDVREAAGNYAFFQIDLRAPADTFQYLGSWPLPRAHNGRFRACPEPGPADDGPPSRPVGVARGGWTYVSMSSGTTLDRELTASAQRAAALRQRLRALRDNVAARFTALQEQTGVDLSFRAQGQARAWSAMDGRPVGDVWVTPETLVLAAVKLLPALRDEVDWPEQFRLAVMRLDMERLWTPLGASWPLHDGWPRLLPSPQVDLGTEAARTAWRGLQRRRVAALDTLWLPLDCEKPGTATLAQGCRVNYASAFLRDYGGSRWGDGRAVPGADDRTLRLPDLVRTRDGRDITYPVLLRLPQPLDSYAVKDGSARVRFEVELRPLRARLEQNVIVIDAQPLRTRARPWTQVMTPGVNLD